MIVQPIHPNTLAQAETAARAVYRTGLDRRPNYAGTTGKPMLDRYRDGWIGEFVVRTWISNAGRWFRFNMSTNGQSQRPEFTLQTRHRFLTTDVKTSGAWHHTRLLNPAAQPITAAFIIAVKLDLPDLRAGIMGAIYTTDFLRLPITTVKGHEDLPSRCCPYHKLPISADRLLSILAR